MKSFVLISRDRPPKSSKMKVRPLEIVRVTLQMGPDDSVWVSLCLCRNTHTCFQRLRYAGNQRGGFSPRNPAGLILKILFDVDKSGHIGAEVFANASYLSGRRRRTLPQRAVVNPRLANVRPIGVTICAATPISMFMFAFVFPKYVHFVDYY